MSEEKNEVECGCGGVCKWGTATKEEKVAMLEKKELKLQKMLSHVQKVKESVKSDKDMSTDEGEE